MRESKLMEGQTRTLIAQEEGDKSVRLFIMPMINLQCEDITDIIDWKSQIHVINELHNLGYGLI